MSECDENCGCYDNYTYVPSVNRSLIVEDGTSMLLHDGSLSAHDILLMVSDLFEHVSPATHYIELVNGDLYLRRKE